jgi:hypothetical protein
MYIVLFCVPLAIWIVVARKFYGRGLSFEEMGLQLLLTSLVIIGIFFLGDNFSTRDTKIVNGSISSMEARQRSCPVGWVTMTDSHCTNYWTRSVKVRQTCSKDSQGNRSCRDVMETQYNYIYPWERRYFLGTTVNKSLIEIDRVDRQGVNKPPAYQAAFIGEPAAVSVVYTNYIQAAKDTILRDQSTSEPLRAPYPKITNYYHAARAMMHAKGTDDKDQFIVNPAWSSDLEATELAIAETGANVVIIVTTETDTSFASRLSKAWDAHNINDIIVVISKEADTQKISWVDVRSWSTSSMVNIVIHDEIMKIGEINGAKINAAIEAAVVEHYKLPDPEDLSYLAEGVPPATWVLALSFIILLIATPIMTWLLANKINIGGQTQFGQRRFR